MYFTVPVITKKKSKNGEKNCHFEIYVHGLSEFLDITDVCPYLEFHENWVFQIFSFWKKTSVKKTTFENF